MISSGQLRDAADVIEEWSQRRYSMNPSVVRWSAKDLREESEHLELEE